MERIAAALHGVRVLAVDVPPLLAASGVHAWSVTELDGTMTLCLDATFGVAAAAAAALRLIARPAVPAPRTPV